VIDTGIGIAKADQKKLFKLFGFVQDSKQMNTKGIGLGLVISEQIVTQFNGDITFESEKDVGSTFTFKFMLEAELENQNLEEKLEDKFNINSNDLQFKWEPNCQENSIEDDI
jgi:signal transduction histidine kinase